MQGGDDAAGFVAQRARLVECRFIAGTDKAAVATQCRQLLGEGLCKFTGKRGIGAAQRLHGIADIARDLRRGRKPFGDPRRGNNAVANCCKVARAATADRNARQRAREVGRRFKPLAHVAAQRCIAHQRLDRIEPMADLRRIGKRRGQALRQQPGTGRGDGPVDRSEQ